VEPVEFLGGLAQPRSLQQPRVKSQEELRTKPQQEDPEYVGSDDDDTGVMVTVYGREKIMKDSNLMRKKLAEEQGLKAKREAVFAEMAPYNADVLKDWIDEDAHTTPTKKVVARARPMSPDAPAPRAAMDRSNPEWHRDNMNRWKRKQADLAKSPVSRKVLKWDSPEGLKEESLRLRRVQAEQKAKWIKDDAVLEECILSKMRQSEEKAECEVNALSAKNILLKKQADGKAKWVNANALKNIKGN
jgi:hypothetical protein